MGTDEITYFLYRLQNSLKFDKCGATIDWDKRCRDNRTSHGDQCIITELETMEGPDTPEFWQVVGDREWELADLYGYPRGTHYREAREKRILAGRKGGESRPVYLNATHESRSKGGKQSMKNRRSISFETAEKIKKEYIPQKVTYRILGERYNCSWNTVRHIIKGWSYKEA